ncbi:MAG: hypothetical protein ABW047_03070 [Nitrospiraceae bacterium]
MLDLHGAMEHAKNIDVMIGLDQVVDSVLPKQYDANVPVRMSWGSEMLCQKETTPEYVSEPVPPGI